jgi:hypothetical protein
VSVIVCVPNWPGVYVIVQFLLGWVPLKVQTVPLALP